METPREACPRCNGQATRYLQDGQVHCAVCNFKWREGEQHNFPLNATFTCGRVDNNFLRRRSYQ